MRFLVNLARIRRIEFLVVELTIFSIPILVSISSLQQVQTWVCAEAFLLFFVLYALGDGINCLADRDLDATYKTHLSRAVYELGVPFVKLLTVLEIIVALGLAVHLSWLTDKWIFLGLVVLGIFLGVGYSIRPFHFKSRGVGHLVCLWLLLYFVPMLYASLIVTDRLTMAVAALAASYATVEMGVILVNTAEDYPEDLEAGVRTTVVALGLRRGITLASWMVAVGGACFVATFLVFYLRAGISYPSYLAIALLAAVCALIARTIWRLAKLTSSHAAVESIREVKRFGKQVPIWATAIGWGGVLCGAVLVTAR